MRRPWLREKSERLLGLLARPIYGGLGSVLRLHRIVAERERSAWSANRSLEITPAELRAVLDWVRRRNFDVLRLDEVRARLASPRGAKFVVFTFDDGYRDTLRTALPIFRDFGMPFTMYVSTGFISRTASVWWYTLEDILAERSELAFVWDGVRRALPLSALDARVRAFADLGALIRAQGTSGRDRLISTICDAAGVDPLGRTRELMLSWEELKAMASEWHVNIGSHGVGHHTLNRLTEDELEAELIEARAELEAQLDRPVRHLAYPFGGRDAVGEREFEMARDADFTTASTSRTANLFHQHAWQLQALPRLTIDGNEPVIAQLRQLECGLLPAKINRWRRIVVE